MNTQEIETNITKILIEVLDITKDEVTIDSTFVNLGADSFDEYDIIVQIEKKFSINIDDRDIDEIVDVRGLCKFVENKLLDKDHNTI